MTEPTEQELIESLNAELQKLGISYTVTEFDKKGGELERKLVEAVQKLVTEAGRPVKSAEISTLIPWAKKGTINSALIRLVDRGKLVGNPDFGYVHRADNA